MTQVCQHIVGGQAAWVGDSLHFISEVQIYICWVRDRLSEFHLMGPSCAKNYLSFFLHMPQMASRLPAPPKEKSQAHTPVTI